MALDRTGGATGTGTSTTETEIALQAHIDDGIDAHDASAISVTDAGGLLAASDVEAALAELATDADNHLADTAGAHAASAIANTPAGGVAATTVQAAIEELDTEKAPLSSPALTDTPTAPTAATGTSSPPR